jgi:hypothetical protein
MFTKQSKTKGVCDRCQIPIYETDAAVCFHADEEELYLCETCVELIREEFIKEDLCNNQ